MALLSIYKGHGVAVKLLPSGSIKLSGLAALGEADRNELLEHARQHKAELVSELTKRNPYYSPTQLNDLNNQYPHLVCCCTTQPPFWWVSRDKCVTCSDRCDQFRQEILQ